MMTQTKEELDRMAGEFWDSDQSDPKKERWLRVCRKMFEAGYEAGLDRAAEIYDNINPACNYCSEPGSFRAILEYRDEIRREKRL